MPVSVKCKICSVSFQTKRSFLSRGYGIYCSARCHHAGLRKGKVILCAQCGQETYRSPKALRRSKSGKHFCGKSCQTAWRNQVFVGPKHANWVHGGQAYRSILRRSGIKAVCRLCGITDKRTLATHHIDEDRFNNNVENLAWLCHNCHHLVHHYDEARQRFMAAVV